MYLAGSYVSPVVLHICIAYYVLELCIHRQPLIGMLLIGMLLIGMILIGSRVHTDTPAAGGVIGEPAIAEQLSMRLAGDSTYLSCDTYTIETGCYE